MHQVALGGFEVDSFYKAAMSSQCEFCGAVQFHRESINCCHSGNGFIPPLKAVPNTIPTLLTLDTKEECHFREHICLYNSYFTFASMQANINIPPGYGPYCYRIHSQIYYWSGPLHPDMEQKRQYIHSSMSWRAIRQ